MFGIGGTELLIVAIFAFIIFGPDKIPEIARTVSKAVNMFKRTQEDMERLVKAEMLGLDPEKGNPLYPQAAAADAGAAPGEKAAKKPSTASSLYGIVDDEEEDEE